MALSPLKKVSSVFYKRGIVFFISLNLLYLIIYNNFKPIHSSTNTNVIPVDTSEIPQHHGSQEANNNQDNVVIHKILLSEGNKSFAENSLWFYEKLTHTEELPLSQYLTNENRTKKILFWNPGFRGGISAFLPGGKNWFKDVGCPIWQCEILRSWENSSKTIKEEDYDAVIIFDPTWANSSHLPAKRSPNQYYVWYNHEAPGRAGTYLRKWNESTNLFNLTLTYRWDSDILAPYGYFRPLLSNETALIQKRNYAEGKSKMAVWFVTNCDWVKNGRLDYVHRLQKHIQVDIYGACGPFKCPNEKQDECRAMMERDYKFVIAFENSLCWDYITEKLFYNMKYNITPIVLDLHGNVARFAPAGSYINALDFSSVKELADYLEVLDRNDTLYNQYFEWKEHYVVKSYFNAPHTNSAARRGMCGLCSKLHDPSRPVNIVKNLTKWWNDEAQCKVLKFPTNHVDNDTWIAKDDDPPYDNSAAP